MDRKKKTILLIDDELTMHSLARAFLENAGYHVISAYDGQQGLEMILKYKPDLVLLDYMMPKMYGDQVYSQLQTNSRFEEVARTPVIVLTARDTDHSLRNRFLEGGVGAYLQKPFGLRELLNIIENVFIVDEIKRKNRQLQDDLFRTREYLESLFQNIPIGILSADRNGTILRVNSTLAAILGEHPGRTIAGGNLLSQDLFQQPDFPVKFRQTLESGKNFQTEPFEFHATADRRVRLIISGVPLRTRDSQDISGLILIVQDVTMLFRREHEMSMLSQISHFMQEIAGLDQLLHLILTAITAGCAMGFSRAMILLLNRKKHVLEGRMGVGPTTQAEANRIWKELGDENIALFPFLEKYGTKHPRDGDGYNKLVKKIIIPTNAANCIFIKAIDSNECFLGKRRDIECNLPGDLLNQLQLDDFIVAPLVAKNKVIGLVIADNQFAFQPIDQGRVGLLKLFANQAGLAIERAEAYSNLEVEKNKLQQAYEELKNTQDRLLHSERLATVGEMAAQVAHEIRNPLVTIGGFARSIERTADKKEISELKNIGKIIAEEVDRLEKVLTNVLDFSRLSKPQPVLTDINKIIEESCYLLTVQEELARIGIHVHRDLDATLPMVLMDPQQIKQVLLNLLQNAVHSMPNGGDLHITSQKTEAGQIRVSVTDSGLGIPADVLEEMFNPFFTTKPDGTGLGLPISEKIIHTHGGKIEVSSEVNRGTTFSFTLNIVTDLNRFVPQSSTLDNE